MSVLGMLRRMVHTDDDEMLGLIERHGDLEPSHLVANAVVLEDDGIGDRNDGRTCRSLDQQLAT